MYLKLEGKLPDGINPNQLTLFVEAEKGTFGLYQGEDRVALGQFANRKKKRKENRLYAG